MRGDEEGVDSKKFVKANPEIYARAKDGGERAKTVHFNHTNAAFSGYIWPKGSAIDLDLRTRPRLIEEARVLGRVDFAFEPDHCMLIDLRGTLEHVTRFCDNHCYRLWEFHAKVKTES